MAPGLTARRPALQVDVDDWPELAVELGVSSMPTFLLFRDGQKVGALRGNDEAALRSLVEEFAVELA